MGEFFTLEQIEAMRGVPQSTIRYWIRAYNLKAAKAGNTYLVQISDFDDFVKKRVVVQEFKRYAIREEGSE